RAIAGVGFVNYDTLYALSWGSQLARGETPAYHLPVAPTPHPLLELLGIVLTPLGAHTEIDVTVALAFAALAACGWVIYSLGAAFFGRAAGALAAVLFLTRVPVLSYGVRAYLDVPYVLFVLSALLVETRRPRAGAPVLTLLALAGLLRPEAWVFSALYWLYLLDLMPASLRRRLPSSRLGPPAAAGAAGGGVSGWARRLRAGRSRRELAWLTLLAAAGPLVWLGSDLLITGNPLYSLTNTRHTAAILDRKSGIADVPQYVPRRIGEVLQFEALLGAGVGVLLTLMWMRRRAAPLAAAGIVAVVVFAAFAAVGLPIVTRYAFLAAALLCIFCGAAVVGWTALASSHPRRRAWIWTGLLVLVLLLSSIPPEYRSAHRELAELARQETIEIDLIKMVRNGAINLRCGPVGVPNHAPIPLLALYLKTSPANVQSAQVSPLRSGVYVDPASAEVEREYVLDPRDPHRAVSVPPGFRESATNRSWLIFKRCE
ncbi:MAG TPA: hypothetical protein VGD00_11070, partial [Solirubrobacteraceae bacterium]